MTPTEFNDQYLCTFNVVDTSKLSNEALLDHMMSLIPTGAKDDDKVWVDPNDWQRMSEIKLFGGSIGRRVTLAARPYTVRHLVLQVEETRHAMIERITRQLIR